MTSHHDPSPNIKRPSWVVLFSVFLAVIFLFFALQGIDWAAFARTILSGHYEFLLITIPIASGNYFLRALRWSILVRAEKPVPIVSVFWANMVGYMGNSFLPARAGELLRSAFLGQKSGLGTSLILATALIERVLDTIALVLIGSICLLALGNVPTILADAVRVMALVGILGLVVIVVVPFQEELFQRILFRLPLPAVLSSTASTFMERFFIGMRSLRNVRRLGLFVLLTLIIWLVDGIGNMIGARIISQTLSLEQSLVFLAGLGLSSAIPSTPGYIGIYQFVAVTVLTPFGFSRSDALAYILISQVLTALTVGFWGLLGLWQINKDQQTTNTINETMGLR